LDVTLFSQVGTCSLLHGGRVNWAWKYLVLI
jgi:hypothetical protein